MEDEYTEEQRPSHNMVMPNYPNQLTEGLLQYQLEPEDIIDEVECLFLR